MSFILGMPNETPRSRDFNNRSCMRNVQMTRSNTGLDRPLFVTLKLGPKHVQDQLMVQNTR